MITCIAIDDQIESLQIIVDHINNTPILSLKLSTTKPVEALNFLNKEMVEVIFIDVKMPILSGLDFIEAIKEKSGSNIPKFVFTTSYDKYALSGFDYGIFDYLLKPISFKRFAMTIERLVNSLKQNTETEEKKEYFFADVDGKKIKINFFDIVYIEGAGNYILVVTLQKKIMLYKSLNSIQEILPNNQFMRIHKSFIIAISKIEALKGNEIIITLNNDVKKIPIGVTYKEEVLKKLKIF